MAKSYVKRNDRKDAPQLHASISMDKYCFFCCMRAVHVIWRLVITWHNLTCCFVHKLLAAPQVRHTCVSESTSVLRCRFVLHLPENLPMDAAAPLLCAGITTYSPLMHYGLNKAGMKIGVVGLGGLGHMAVKIGKAMGLEVKSSSSSGWVLRAVLLVCSWLTHIQCLFCTSSLYAAALSKLVAQTLHISDHMHYCFSLAYMLASWSACCTSLRAAHCLI